MPANERTVKIRGLAELQKVLATLGEKMAARVWRSAINAGAGVIRRSVRNAAPVGRGHLTLRSTRRRVGIKRWHLKDSIVVQNVTSRGRATQFLKYRVKSDDPKAHLVERGTRRHRVDAMVTTRKVLRQLEDGRVAVMILPNGRFITGYNHPGTRPRPFFGPALNRDGERAIRAIVETAGKRINRMAVK